MKALASLMLLSVFVFGCKVKPKPMQKIEEPKFIVDARYSAYQTAMGKGRGVIFRINIKSATENNYTLDSLYVNGLHMPYVIIQNGNPMEIEANYMKTIPDPGYDPNGNVKPNIEITDPILINQQYYPSWILIKHEGKIEKVIIDNYKKIN